MNSHLIWLAVLMAVNSIIGAYYYFRLIVVMYMREPVVDEVLPRVNLGMAAAMTICAVATLYLGVFPGQVLAFAQQSARTFIH